MKHLKLLFLLMITLFISCSDDDNTSTTTQSDFLIGAWKGISFTREDNGVTYDTSNCEDLDTMASYRTFIFIDESNLHYNDTCSGGTGNNGSYSLANNVLTFDLGDGPVYGDVTVISETKLELGINGYGSFILEKQL